MNSYYGSLLVEASPGLTIVSVALMASLPPYLVMYKSRRGRARGSIAYICGFLAGLATTALIAATFGGLAPDDSPILAGGVMASFFAPFVGMLRARLRRPPARKQSRGQARGHAYSR